MVLGINNFFDARNKNAKVADFQDLDHLDGVSVSAVSANLYDQKRDDLVLFYFRNGANHSSLFTKSSVVSENIKWNRKIKSQKIHALLINTRNANALTGSDGYDALKILSKELSEKLTLKQKQDEEYPKIIRSDSILFACTGTIGEKFPLEKIKNSLPNLVDNIKYNQNKLIWMKAASGIKTTDTKPKLAMSECKIGNTPIKVYGIAKGSGMIKPDFATLLSFVFVDAKLNSSSLKRIHSKALEKSLTPTRKPNYSQLRHPFAPQTIFSEDEIFNIHDTALKVLEELGIKVLLPEARDIFKKAGARVQDEMTFIGRDIISTSLKSAPNSIKLCAANPERALTYEDGALIFSPGAGCPNATDHKRGRPKPTFCD